MTLTITDALKKEKETAASMTRFDKIFEESFDDITHLFLCSKVVFWHL